MALAIDETISSHILVLPRVKSVYSFAKGSKEGNFFMFCQILLWNPINLIDGEGRWFINELLLIAGAFFLTKLLGSLTKYGTKTDQKPYLSATLSALYLPLVYLIWIYVGLLSIDLISDSYISQTYTKVWPLLFSVTSILFFGWFLLRLKGTIVRYLIAEKTKEGSSDTFTIHALSKILTISIIVLVFILLNDITGMSFTTLLAFGGVGGLALAFASQEIISNFFGGLMLHITRPFVTGETIYFPNNNIEGSIEEIGWYQTSVRSLQKTEVYIPNALFTKAILINKSRTALRPFEQKVYVKAPSLDGLKTIVESLEKILESHPEVSQDTYCGVKINEIGPITTLLITGMTINKTNEKFLHFANKLYILSCEAIENAGGILSNPPSSSSS